MTPLPHIDISSPEAARKSRAEYGKWLADQTFDSLTKEQNAQAGYVRCCIDAMRFPNAHKSEAMKQAAQEAIEKLKAMLAATEMRGRLTIMTIGESIKVWLPGESPWAIVTAILPDGRIMARIDNHPVSGMHGYKYGDVATFRREKTSEWDLWKLAPLDQQEKIGPR